MRVINNCRIDFQYKLWSSGPVISNTIFSNNVSTELINKMLEVKKCVDKKVTTIFEVLTYRIFISNISDIDVTNVFFRDLIPEGTRFIRNTVFINETKKRCVDPSCGFNLGTIYSKDTIVISFKVVILQHSKRIITNSSNSIYDYIYNTEKPPMRVKIKSNHTKTLVKMNLFKQINIGNKFFVDSQFPQINNIKEVKTKVNIINTKIVSTPVASTNFHKELNLCKLIIIGKIEYFIEYKYLCNRIREGNKKLTYTRGFSCFLLVPNGIQYCKIKNIEHRIENISYNLLNKRCFFIDLEMLIKL